MPDIKGMTDFLLVPSRVIVTVRLSLMRASLLQTRCVSARLAGPLCRLGSDRSAEAWGRRAKLWLVRRLWRRGFSRNLRICGRSRHALAAPPSRRSGLCPSCIPVYARAAMTDPPFSRMLWVSWPAADHCRPCRRCCVRCRSARLHCRTGRLCRAQRHRSLAACVLPDGGSAQASSAHCGRMAAGTWC